MGGLVKTLFSLGGQAPDGVAVDGSGNVDVSVYSSTYKWPAANNTVSVIPDYSCGVALDGSGNFFAADLGHALIYELPRAFVNPTPRIEGLAAGNDTLPPVLPTTESLLPPFAPVPGQSWLAITGLSGDAVGFTFPATTSARESTISLYGQQVLIAQENNPVSPQITGFERLGANTVQFTFTNNPNTLFSVLVTTNVTLPLPDWTLVGMATNISAGLFQFTDTQATNSRRFYMLRSP